MKDQTLEDSVDKFVLEAYPPYMQLTARFPDDDIGEKRDSNIPKRLQAKEFILALVKTEVDRATGYSIPDITHIRKELKLTQADMAVVAGVSRLTFINWEKHPEKMTIGAYVKLADEYRRLKRLNEREDKNL